MKSVILINGSINSGKSTTGEYLSTLFEKAIFVDGDHHGQKWNGDLEKKIQAALGYIKLSLVSSDWIYAFVAYPLRQTDYNNLHLFCTNHSWRCVCVTISPPLHVALSPRGNRLLQDWEKCRIEEMYAEGYHQRTFSDLVIDNSGISLENTASEIISSLGL